MNIGFASDHRGFRLKNVLMEFLKTRDFAVTDFGTYSKESCDYPDYAYILGRAVREKRVDRGILLCYTGVGSTIAANKVKGVRAGLVWNMKIAQMSRKHNNVNIAVLPSGFLTHASAKKIVWKWLKTEFEGGRHLRRIRKIKHIEEKENV
jgi:ribose 5-phosphate isomerase B